MRIANTTRQGTITTHRCVGVCACVCVCVRACVPQAPNRRHTKAPAVSSPSFSYVALRKLGSDGALSTPPLCCSDHCQVCTCAAAHSRVRGLRSTRCCVFATTVVDPPYPPSDTRAKHPRLQTVGQSAAGVKAPVPGKNDGADGGDGEGPTMKQRYRELRAAKKAAKAAAAAAAAAAAMGGGPGTGASTAGDAPW